MGGIKYYQLAKGEEMPDEFCAVRDMGGEPSEYVFYVPDAENAKLRELVKEMRVCLEDECKRCHEWGDICDLEHQMRELGVEVDG